MNESKIELTERLRREGRWSEASLFKDESLEGTPQRRHDEGRGRRRGTAPDGRTVPAVDE